MPLESITNTPSIHPKKKSWIHEIPPQPAHSLQLLDGRIGKCTALLFLQLHNSPGFCNCGREWNVGKETCRSFCIDIHVCQLHWIFHWNDSNCNDTIAIDQFWCRSRHRFWADQLRFLDSIIRYSQREKEGMLWLNWLPIPLSDAQLLTQRMEWILSVNWL